MLECIIGRLFFRDRTFDRSSSYLYVFPARRQQMSTDHKRDWQVRHVRQGLADRLSNGPHPGSFDDREIQRKSGYHFIRFQPSSVRPCKPQDRPAIPVKQPLGLPALARRNAVSPDNQFDARIAYRRRCRVQQLKDNVGGAAKTVPLSGNEPDLCVGNQCGVALASRLLHHSAPENEMDCRRVISKDYKSISTRSRTDSLNCSNSVTVLPACASNNTCVSGNRLKSGITNTNTGCSWLQTVWCNENSNRRDGDSDAEPETGCHGGVHNQGPPTLPGWPAT